MNKPIKSFVFIICIAIFTSPASAGFFGPSTKLLTGDALAQKLQSQAVVFDLAGSVLDVRSKSAAVGGFLLGFVLSSAMASGGGVPQGASAQQMQQNMQANMQMAMQFNQNIQTTFASVAASQAAKPSGQVGKEGPVVLVAQQLAASLAQSPSIKVSFLTPNQKAKPTDLQLRITQPVWLLDFSMASSDYTLSHRVEVSLYQKADDTLFFKQSCEGAADSKKPKEEWEKDDFAAVASVALDAGNKCAAKIIAALGLQLAKVQALVAPTADQLNTTGDAALQVLPVATTETVAAPTVTPAAEATAAPLESSK